MILLGVIGEDITDYRSFFASWFIFLFLIVLEYVEIYQFKRFEERSKIVIWFYRLAIFIFSILTFIFLLGSFGLITIDSELVLQPDSQNVIMQGLFQLTLGNSIRADYLILFNSLAVLIFFTLECFTNPVESYREKHKLKNKIKHKKKGEVAG